MNGMGLELTIAAVVFTVILLLTMRLSAREGRGGTPGTGTATPPRVQMTEAEVDAGIARLGERIEALTRPGLKGHATGPAATPRTSRIGGPILWPVGRDMPKGLPHMRCLAHIDLAELPPLSPLPREGVLQVFIEIDDVWGCHFPSTQYEGFLIVLHRDVTDWSEVAPLKVADESMGMPIDLADPPEHGLALRWEVAEIPPPDFDYRLRDVQFPYRLESHVYRRLEAEVYEPLQDRRGRYDVLLLGHAGFTQDDFRRPDRYADHENLIGFSSSGGAFMWGDVGEATIMIPAEDMAGMRLDRAIYSWDCS